MVRLVKINHPDMKTIATLLASASLALAASAGDAKAPAKNPITPVIDPHANVVFAGLDMREYSWYTHLGYMYALNGDLGTSGLFVRAFSGLGEYEYRQRGLSNPEVGGRLFDADLALGYRYVTGNWVIGGFAGVHLHDFDLFDSDPTNPGEGTDWGARFGLDITGTTGPIYWSAIGQYSTVEEAIWSRARVGYMFGRVTVGPEFVYLEDDRFDEYRIGGFVRVKILENLSVTGAAGSAYYDGQFQDDDQSFYGSLGLVVTF